uniref:Uncharacterized protein n=1 Tax=Coccidioides posadasii RMSCC 3488 TaxID=454284 RepID=A0A0J6FNZ2_COCPO|nr:hypothetical protein CPAG_07457 [Coccidioides posadasii RMSCC 3488]
MVHADKRQRVQNGAGLLLSYLSGSRLVSLFDTPARGKPPPGGEPWLKECGANAMSPLTQPLSPNKPTGVQSRVRSWLADCDDSMNDTASDIASKEDLTDDEEDVSITESDIKSIVFSKVLGSSTQSSYSEVMQLNDVRKAAGGGFDLDYDLNPADLIRDDESAVTDDGKAFVIAHHPEPIFDLLSHLVAMAFYNDAFDAEFTSLKDIYWHPIPPHLHSMVVKIQANKLGIPVFHEPEMTESSYPGCQHTCVIP